MKILIHPFSRKLRNGRENPKNYPFWGDLISMLRARGDTITQIGNEQDKRLVPDFTGVISYDKMEELVKQCDVWIGCDSFLQHLGWFLGKRGIVLWSKSDPWIFGHPENVNLFVSRTKFRNKQFDMWEEEPYDHSAFVAPERVIDAVASFTSGAQVQ